MRKFTFTALMLLLAMVLISACSGGNGGQAPAGEEPVNEAEEQTAEQPAQEGEPAEGGTFVFGVTGDPVTFNPLFAGDRVSLTINQALFAPLFQVNNGEKTFYLAESLEPSEDGLTYMLKLRDDAYWHDGEKVTADDVVFTVEKILDETQNSFLRANFMIGGSPVEAVKVDDTTVEFKLPQASAAFEAVLEEVFPIPQHIFENETDLAKSELNNQPVGSGPFKFKEYKTGEYVELVRNDQYFGGKPYLDSVVYRIAKDMNTANLALQNGEIHVKYIDPQDVPTFEATNNFEIIPYSEGRLFYLSFNQNSDTGLLSNSQVRQAISHALNREELIQVAYLSSEYADPAHSFLTPDALYHTNDVTTYDYDPERAKQLLEEAGATDLKLRFITRSGDKIQEAVSLYVQQKLGEIGVEVELQSLDSSAFIQKLIDTSTSDYELIINGYIMGYEPDAYRILYESSGSSNFANYSNPDADRLFEAGATETDPAEREKIYKELQEIIAKDAPIYPIAYPKTIVALNKQFGGVEEAVLKPVYIFEDLSKIYRKQ